MGQNCRANDVDICRKPRPRIPIQFGEGVATSPNLKLVWGLGVEGGRSNYLPKPNPSSLSQTGVGGSMRDRRRSFRQECLSEEIMSGAVVHTTPASFSVLMDPLFSTAVYKLPVLWRRFDWRVEGFTFQDIFELMDSTSRCTWQERAALSSWWIRSGRFSTCWAFEVPDPGW